MFGHTKFGSVVASQLSCRAQSKSFIKISGPDTLQSFSYWKVKFLQAATSENSSRERYLCIWQTFLSRGNQTLCPLRCRHNGLPIELRKMKGLQQRNRSSSASLSVMWGCSSRIKDTIREKPQLTDRCIYTGAWGLMCIDVYLCQALHMRLWMYMFTLQTLSIKPVNWRISCMWERNSALTKQENLHVVVE